MAGCHPGECHFTTGNLYARRQFYLLKRFVQYLGLEEGRVNFAWISSAEGEKFVTVARKVIEDVKKLGPAKKLIKSL